MRDGHTRPPDLPLEVRTGHGATDALAPHERLPEILVVPRELERPAGFPSSDKTRPDSPVPTLQGPCGRSPKRRGSLNSLPQLEKNHVVPTSWQDEALSRDGVSREVPCSALKGETVPDSLPATPKSPPTRRGPPRGTNPTSVITWLTSHCTNPRTGSQHAGEKRGVAGLLLGRTERAARAAELQLCAQAR